MRIDLNGDLGEGCAADAELMALVTSANIACGRHAGDPGTMAAALALAAAHRVRVGAHPGYDDRAHFGRRELPRTEDELFAECAAQIEDLRALCEPAGVPGLRYVKPHGAMYHQACRDDGYARPVVAAAARFGLAVMGLPASRLEAAARGVVPYIREGFADRRYRPDGTLVPRSEPDAFVHDADEAVAQAEDLIRRHGVASLCVHGDNPQAVAFARALRAALARRGFLLSAD